MTTFRRLGFLKPKKEKVAREKTVKAPELRLMGLKHKEGDVVVEDKKLSAQMKLNAEAVKLMGLIKGDKIDILESDHGNFLIAKVGPEDFGATLSANKNTESLSFTYKRAHNLMKDYNSVYEVTNETFDASKIENVEDREAAIEALGSYTWYILVPGKATSEKVETAEEKIEEEVVNPNPFN